MAHISDTYTLKILRNPKDSYKLKYNSDFVLVYGFCLISSKIFFR